MGDDHLHDFIREGVGGFMRAARHWRWTTEEVIDLNFTLMPDVDHTNRDVCPYGANNAKVGAIYEHR